MSVNQISQTNIGSTAVLLKVRDAQGAPSYDLLRGELSESVKVGQKIELGSASTGAVKSIEEDRTSGKYKIETEDGVYVLESLPGEAFEAAGQVDGSEAFEHFIDEVIADFGLPNGMSDGELRDSLKTRFQIRVLRVLTETLDGRAIQELGEKIEKENLADEKLVDYLMNKVPDAKKKILSAIDDLCIEIRQEYELAMRVAAAQTVNQTNLEKT